MLLLLSSWFGNVLSGDSFKLCMQRHGKMYTLQKRYVDIKAVGPERRLHWISKRVLEFKKIQNLGIVNTRNSEFFDDLAVGNHLVEFWNLSVGPNRPNICFIKTANYCSGNVDQNEIDEFSTSAVAAFSFFIFIGQFKQVKYLDEFFNPEVCIQLWRVVSMQASMKMNLFKIWKRVRELKYIHLNIYSHMCTYA